MASQLLQRRAGDRPKIRHTAFVVRVLGAPQVVPRFSTASWCFFLLWMVLASPAFAQSTDGVAPSRLPVEVSPTSAPATLTGDWHYGAYLDLSYIVNFNFPENHLWRSRTTSNQHNELAPNMGLVYVRKDVTTESRWGGEFGFQAGNDSKDFAFLQGEQK